MPTLNSILAGVQTALTGGTSPLFTPNCCFCALDPQITLNFPPSDIYCTISPATYDVKQMTWQPNNAVSYIIKWHFVISLFVRLTLDESNQDTIYLTNATLGSLTNTDNIVSALQNYVNSDGHQTYGYRLDGIQFPSTIRNGIGWGITTLLYHTDSITRSL